MAQKKQSVYSRIALDLIDKIKNGTYAKGSMLPPERELMDIYKVERTTVRRGLELLRCDGYIRKVAGLGSVVMSDTPIPENSESVSVATSEVIKKADNTAKKASSILALFPDGKNGTYRTDTGIADPITEALSGVCRKNSAKLTILSSTDAEHVVGTLRKAHADSCVIFFGTDEKVVDALKNEGINICFALCKAKGYRCILPDIHSSCEAAVEYLSSLSHKTVAFIGGDENSYLQREYRIGFTNEFSARNPQSDINNYTNTGGWDEKSGFERISELIRRSGGKFTAVVTVNDAVAAGAIKAAKYYRLSIPEDISVISLCSTSQESQADSVFNNPEHIALEIFNSCTQVADGGYSITCTCDSELLCGKTTGKAKDSNSSGRRLSDFLL